MQRDQKQRSHRDLSSRAAAILKGKAKNDVKRIDSEVEAETEAETEASEEASDMPEFDEMSTDMIDNLAEGLKQLKRLVLGERNSSMNASQGHPRPTTSDTESLVELLDGDGEESGGSFFSASDGSPKAICSDQRKRDVNDHTIAPDKIPKVLRDLSNVQSKSHRGIRGHENDEPVQESDEDTDRSSPKIYQSSATSVGPRRTNKGKPSSSNGSTRQAKRR